MSKSCEIRELSPVSLALVRAFPCKACVIRRTPIVKISDTES
jgi:hypothetical protein